LSAFYAVQSGKKALILDFDAHCGGGTFAHISKFYEENPEHIGKISQVDVSTNWFDSYGFGDEYFVDQETPEWASLMVMSQKTDYIEMIKLGLQVAETYRDENTVVIYNAGTDPLGYWGIDELVLAEREKLVSEWIGDTPAVFALAGGYSGKNFDRNDVARTHLLNINEWAWKTSNK
jgi:acetoin utilization deacetylase AcuC-like enzyme